MKIGKSLIGKTLINKITKDECRVTDIFERNNEILITCQLMVENQFNMTLDDLNEWEDKFKIDEDIIRNELTIFLLDVIKIPKLTSNIVNEFIEKCKKKQEENNDT